MANIYKFRQWSLTIIRLVLGLIFVYHGYLKLFVKENMQNSAELFLSLGIPFSSYSSIAFSVIEFAAGVFLILGLYVKYASLFAIVRSLLARSMFNLKNGFLVTNNGIEYLLLILFSATVLLFNGPGRLSFDRLVADDEEGKELKNKYEKNPKSVQVREFEGNGLVAKVGITKEKGYLYFVDKQGDISRVKMARKGQKTSKKQELIAKVGVKRKDGYLYFIDKNGNVSQAKMARG